jgi:hypothetical protein
MLNTRSARASIEIDRAKLNLQSLSSDQVSMETIEVTLQGLGYPLPLGWRLSTMTRYRSNIKKGCQLDAAKRTLKGKKVPATLRTALRS